MLGDVVGKPGRKAAADLVPYLRDQYNPDFVSANAENAAGGFGLTPETARELFDAGIDALTLGNHSWAKRELADLLKTEPRIIRPANFAPQTPGRGFGVFSGSGGRKIGLLNLVGRTFMMPADDPFRKADAVLQEIHAETRIALVDIHAEATSEKAALGWYLDGRATAVVGTHTHVQTSDERVLPQGTAYITDVGMLGPRDSVLGMKKEHAIERFLTFMRSNFDVAGGPYIFNAVAIIADYETGSALSIKRILIQEETENRHSQ